MAKPQINEEREKHLAEALWLNYFNNFLFQEGTITEIEYKRMVEKIAVWSARRSRGGAVQVHSS